MFGVSGGSEAGERGVVSHGGEEGGGAVDFLGFGRGSGDACLLEITRAVED